MCLKLSIFNIIFVIDKFKLQQLFLAMEMEKTQYFVSDTHTIL